MRHGVFEAMGTKVEAWTESEQRFQSTIDWFEQVESVCSRFRPDSELSALNRDPRPTVPVSPLLGEVLRSAAQMRMLTGGLLDIGMGGPLIEWGYDRTFEEVTDVEDEPNQAAGVGDWDLHGDSVTRTPGTLLDLGGIGKGWTCDRAVESGLAEVVSAGGDLRSSHADTVVPVMDPWGEVVATLDLGVGALATSSVTRRRWIVGKREAHHVIDPRTLKPASTPVLSATVLAETAAMAEAGATSVLILGESGLTWADDQTWISAAIVIWHDGSVYATQGVEIAA